MERVRKEKKRDQGEYDTTQLHENHGKILHRDYSAHFFRWSFARRVIGKQDAVLEIGCGEDKPLSKILTGNMMPYVRKYVGVDLNKLKPSNNQRLTFHGEFNFVDRYKELIKEELFDVVVHLEVIEHMNVANGAKFLKACYACLKPGGKMVMSTPVYDGVHHAANHIHEYEVDELAKAVKKAGFVVDQRFGTFMDIKHIGKVAPDPQFGVSDNEVLNMRKALSHYFDNDALSNIFGPLHSNHARNNLWVCTKPE